MTTVQLRRMAWLNPATPEFLSAAEDVTFVPLEAVWPNGRADFSRRADVADVASGYTRFRAGDVLQPKVTPTFAHGRSTVAAIDTPVGAASTEVHVLRAKSHACARYLAYVGQSRPFISEGMTRVEGVGNLLRVPPEFVAQYRLPLMSRTEQEEIADFLDRETAQIDTMIEAQEDLLQTLINRRAATRRRGFFALRDMADIRPLKHLARKVSGSAFPLEEQGEKGLDLPFYKVAALASRDVHGIIVTESDTIASETRARLGARVIPTGSSLMAKIGAASLLARIGIISRDCCIDNNMVAFIPRTGVDPRFLYHALCDIDIYPYINQSTIPYMNERAIINAPIPLPNLAEQRRLVDKLDRELAKGSALVAETESMIFLLRERREALITAAVSGRIDPTTSIERIEEAS